MRTIHTHNVLTLPNGDVIIRQIKDRAQAIRVSVIAIIGITCITLGFTYTDNVREILWVLGGIFAIIGLTGVWIHITPLTWVISPTKERIEVKTKFSNKYYAKAGIKELRYSVKFTKSSNLGTRPFEFHMINILQHGGKTIPLMNLNTPKKSLTKSQVEDGVELMQLIGKTLDIKVGVDDVIDTDNNI